MEEKEKINLGGRPTKYLESFNKQAYKLCLLGATDKELADFFEVDEATINRWKTKYKGFCKSLKTGKTRADSIVAEKLFQRATGYEAPDFDIKVIGGRIVKTTLIKHFPPDTTAAIFWLKNRQKEKWRDKQEFEHSTVDSGLSIADLPDELAKQIYAFKKAKLNGDQTN